MKKNVNSSGINNDGILEGARLFYFQIENFECMLLQTKMDTNT